MNDGPQEGVPLSHALGNGTLGQPQRARPTLKALAARVLEGARETVPLSHAIGTGTVGQVVTSPASSESERAGEWNTEDWQAYFDERAGIAEHDGGLSRADAERQALANTVNQWLVMHPPPATDDNAGCVHCNAGLGEDGVPVLAGAAHTWVHSVCHPPWLAERRRQAAEALQAVGIEAAGQ